MILTKYYNFSEVILTFSTNLFLLSFLLSGIISNIYFSNKINFFKLALLSIFGFLLSISIIVLGLYFNLNHSYIYVAKIIEGLSFGLYANIFGYFFKIILLKNKKNNLINSINTSIVYSFKSFIPIIISSLFIIKGAEYTMYFAGILVYSIAIIYTILNSKKINLITKSHINRYHGKSYQKKNFIDNIKNITKFYNKVYLKEKIYYTLIVSIQNFSRPFYDLYMVIYLIDYQNCSVVISSLLLSGMVLGQASQVVSSYILTKTGIKRYRLLGLSIYSIAFVIIINIDYIYTNTYLAFIIFYILGLGRSFYANYEYAYIMSLSRKIRVNEMDFASMLIREASHNLSYLILGIVLLFGYSVKDLFNLWYFIIIFLFILWYLFDSKNEKFFESGR